MLSVELSGYIPVAKRCATGSDTIRARIWVLGDAGEDLAGLGRDIPKRAE